MLAAAAPLPCVVDLRLKYELKYFNEQPNFQPLLHMRVVTGTDARQNRGCAEGPNASGLDHITEIDLDNVSPDFYFENNTDGKDTVLARLIPCLRYHLCNGNTSRLCETAWMTPPELNSALVFVKPHALTAKAVDSVRKQLKDEGIGVLAEGEIDGSAASKLIDRHYYAHSSKALASPVELDITAKGKAAFVFKFGLDWENAIKSDRVLSADQAMARLNLTATQLGDACGDDVKLGSGCYAALVKHEGQCLAVINGYYPAMAAEYLSEGPVLHYFVVVWRPDHLSWSEFRKNVIGGTNPSGREQGSLRAHFMRNWKELGLKSQPSMVSNCIHGSASPFEGYLEKANWTKTVASIDLFGQQLLDLGFTEHELDFLALDPMMIFDRNSSFISVFDRLEGLDSDATLQALSILKEHKLSVINYYH